MKNITEEKVINGYAVCYRYKNGTHLETAFDDKKRAEKFARKVAGNIIEKPVVVFR